nr:cytochrome c [Acetobacter oeni]
MFSCSASAENISPVAQQGEYVARAADCAACHTLPGHDQFSGGLPFDLPFGTIFSSNISPDRDHGIGRYTESQFSQAVRQGIRADGAPLYPAMPYPSYARMTDADIHALYIYFTTTVRPSPETPPASTATWPLSMRWPLHVWQAFFVPSAEQARKSTARFTEDDMLARGAYLVEGPGHCGACHTPRAMTLQEKALTAQESAVFLSGGNSVDGWTPTSLRGENRTGLGRWSEVDIVGFLRNGRTARGSVFGGMTSAIVHGTQYLNDKDLSSIAHFLKSLPACDKDQPPWQYSPTETIALHNGDTSARGARLYADRCAACHRTDGYAYPTTFPPLAGNPVVMNPAPDSLIQIVLAGSTLPAMRSSPTTFVMPGFGKTMTDQQVADVVSFIRASWGNDTGPISKENVRRLRKFQSKIISHTQIPLN